MSVLAETLVKGGEMLSIGGEGQTLVKTGLLLYRYYLLLSASEIPLLTYLFTYSSQEMILPCRRAR